MNNGRFAIAIHILTLLEYSKGELLSSDYIAGSININPVLVRKEIGVLKKAGLVNSKEGKNGGCYLLKDAAKITFEEVFKIVYNGNLLSFAKNKPNPKCPIGNNINNQLEKLYADAENALYEKLKENTLKKFCEKFN